LTGNKYGWQKSDANLTSSWWNHDTINISWLNPPTSLEIQDTAEVFLHNKLLKNQCRMNNLNSQAIVENFEEATVEVPIFQWWSASHGS